MKYHTVRASDETQRPILPRCGSAALLAAYIYGAGMGVRKVVVYSTSTLQTRA